MSILTRLEPNKVPVYSREMGQWMAEQLHMPADNEGVAATADPIGYFYSRSSLQSKDSRAGDMNNDCSCCIGGTTLQKQASFIEETGYHLIIRE